MYSKIIALFLYYSIAKHLPSRSFLIFPSKFRSFLSSVIFKRCGDNFNIASGVKFGRGKNISVGNNSGIGENVYITCLDEVIIGDDVMISPFVKILTGGHEFNDPEKLLVFQRQTSSKVVIGNDVWLGTSSIILPGAIIESRVIIAAGSIVTAGTYDSGWVYGGNPARKIKKIPCIEKEH